MTEEQKALALSLDFEGKGVRVMGTPEEPLFVAADVCRALEISNNRDALERLDTDEKGVGSSDRREAESLNPTQLDLLK